MSDDLTARVAGLASLIEARLAEDVDAAVDAETGAVWIPALRPVMNRVARITGADPDRAAARQSLSDPARALRRVKATRELVAVILAEGHDYIPGDEYYSCSQAIDPYPGESGEPGSGCSDPERAGKPCDCGRDAKVVRMLEIIAGEWEARDREG